MGSLHQDTVDGPVHLMELVCHPRAPTDDGPERAILVGSNEAVRVVEGTVEPVQRDHRCHPRKQPRRRRAPLQHAAETTHAVLEPPALVLVLGNPEPTTDRRDEHDGVQPGQLREIGCLLQDVPQRHHLVPALADEKSTYTRSTPFVHKNKSIRAINF